MDFFEGLCFNGFMSIKIKTFSQSLEIFKTTRELESLDEQVNAFIKQNNVKEVISVSDSTTEGPDGTIGLIRVVAYQD